MANHELHNTVYFVTILNSMQEKILMLRYVAAKTSGYDGLASFGAMY